MFRQEAIIEGNGEVFKVGDIVEVHYKKVYQDFTSVCVGKILKPITLSELRLDVSDKYNAKIVEIEMCDVVEMYSIEE